MNILRKIIGVVSGVFGRSADAEESGPYPYFCLCDGQVTPARDLYAANAICIEYLKKHTRRLENGEVSQPQCCCFYDVFGTRHNPVHHMNPFVAIKKENAWRRRTGLDRRGWAR
jgi:hypothetical protein